MNLLKPLLLILILNLTSCLSKEDKSSEIDPTNDISTKLDSALSIEEKRKFTISNSEVFVLKSKHTKKKYDIYVKLPSGYTKSKKQYPILILTDAGYAFPLVSSIYRRLKFSNKIDEIIIVGISYAKGEHFGISRTRDYTPTFSPNEPNGYSKEARLSSGQADNFILFMKNELIPLGAKER